MTELFSHFWCLIDCQSLRIPANFLLQDVHKSTEPGSQCSDKLSNLLTKWYWEFRSFSTFRFWSSSIIRCEYGILIKNIQPVPWIQYHNAESHVYHLVFANHSERLQLRRSGRMPNLLDSFQETLLPFLRHSQDMDASRVVLQPIWRQRALWGGDNFSSSVRKQPGRERFSVRPLELYEGDIRKRGSLVVGILQANGTELFHVVWLQRHWLHLLGQFKTQ